MDRPEERPHPSVRPGVLASEKHDQDRKRRERLKHHAQRIKHFQQGQEAGK